MYRIAVAVVVVLIVANTFLTLTPESSSLRTQATPWLSDQDGSSKTVTAPSVGGYADFTWVKEAIGYPLPLLLSSSFIQGGRAESIDLFAEFEEGFEEWEGGKPVGWDAAGDVTRSSQIVFEGDFSARVQRRADVSGYSAGMLMREVEIPADDLMFSFAYYAENIGESTDYVLGLYFSDGSWLVYTFNERQNPPNVHYIQIPQVENKWATYSRNIEQDLLSSYGDSNKVLKKIAILVIDEKMVLFVDQLRFHLSGYSLSAVRVVAINLARLLATSLTRVVSSVLAGLSSLVGLLPSIEDLVPFLPLVCFLFFLLFGLGWLPIGIGIFLIGLAGVTLVFDSPMLSAESFVVYAYYFLVMGLVLRVIEYIRKSDKRLISSVRAAFRRGRGRQPS